MAKITNPYYEELAYIESTGTQYIDTGIMASQMASLNYEIDFQLPTTSQSDYASMGCGNWGSSGWYGNILSFGSSHSGIMTRMNSISDTKLGNKDTNRHKLIIDTTNSVAIYDGVSTNITVSSTTGIGSLLLFGSSSLNGSTPYNTTYCKCRIYSFKIGTLRDFVPARKKDTGVIGLLDIVTNTFYTNSGTGTFSYGLLTDVTVDPVNSGTITGVGEYTVGSNVTLTAIPNSGYNFEKWINKEYILLSAIESTGTQYIDTGVANKTGLQFLVKCTFKDSTGRGTVLAQSNSSRSAPWISREIIRPCVGYKTYNIDPYLNLDELYTIVVNDNMCVINGTQYQYTSNADILPGGNLWIFRRADGNHYGKVKLQMLQIYDGTSIIRDFVPVMRQGDLAVGLLDLVEMKFYGNSGTGQFNAYEESGPTQYPSMTDNPLTITNISNSIILTAQFKRTANCRYKVNGAWKNAMMYIKQNGTWKPGTPKIKINGNWKEGG